MEAQGNTQVEIEQAPAYARSYQHFWPYFMARHEHPVTQWLHVLATVLGLLCILIMFPLTLNGAWIVTAFAVAYPIAWFSHLFFEKKKPAAWSHPYWSFLGDLDMMAMKFMGTLDAEMARLRAEPDASFSRTRRIVHHSREVLFFACVLAIVVLGLRGSITFANPFGP